MVAIGAREEERGAVSGEEGRCGERSFGEEENRGFGFGKGEISKDVGDEIGGFGFSDYEV